MVAIVIAALFGAGVSTLLLAKFGLLTALLAIPIGGSAAGMAAALGLAVARDRHFRGRTCEPRAEVRAFPVAR